MSTVKVEAIELYAAGEKTGEAAVRAFLRDGVERVAPKRDSLNDALLDVVELERNGLHSFWVTYASRGFRVFAATGEAAADLAHQRWPDLGWPASVACERKVADVVEHPDAEVIRERVTA